MGRIICRIGIAGILISLLMLLIGALASGPVFSLGVFMLFFSLLIAALGLMIWLFVVSGKRKQIGGFILFLMGTIGLLISYILIKAAQGTTEDIPQFVYGLFALVVGSISIIFLVVGIILLIVGSNQAKKQKNQNIPQPKDR